MSEGTLQPTTNNIGASEFDVEHTFIVTSGVKRASIKISDFPRVSTLRTLFASVKLVSLVAEARQDSDVGSDDGELVLAGHVYLAVIPTCKDSDAMTGSTAIIVNNVPNKQTMPLASSHQSNEIFNFNLEGYEVDLAQDPRRGAGPVAWVGNSGVTTTKTTKGSVNVVTVTWKAKVSCSGATPLWQ